MTDLELALAAARAGADVIRRMAPADARRSAREKGRADLVTAADEAAERAILEVIRGARPDDAMLAEEGGGRDSAEGDRRWIVDPVDGTTNLVHGHPFCCVSIALEDEEGLAVAVVGAPHLGEVYSAERGGGAFLNGSAIRVSEVDRWEGCLVGTGFPFRSGKGDMDPYMRLVGSVVGETQGVRRAGSAALDLAYVACGRLDAFFEIGLSPWDVAAGILLIREAGGMATGWPADSAAPERTGRVLASNGLVHARLQAAVAAFEREIG